MENNIILNLSCRLLLSANTLTEEAVYIHMILHYNFNALQFQWLQVGWSYIHSLRTNLLKIDCLDLGNVGKILHVQLNSIHFLIGLKV